MKKNTEKKPINKKKVLNIVANTVLVLILVFGVFCSFTAFTAKQGYDVPQIFGLQFFAIQSDSMEKTFYKGDLIVDTQVKDPTTLRVNDVITFKTVIKGEKALNTHRIIEIKDYGTHIKFVTQGDNAKGADALEVHQSEVVGLYRFAIPKLGGFIDFLQTSLGFLLVIVLPVFLFFAYNLVQFFRVFMNYRMEKMKDQLRADLLREELAAAGEPPKEKETKESGGN